MKYDYILVLESPEGMNKSTVIEKLAGSDFFSDQTILGVSDREAQEQMSGVWLYEIADLSGIGKAEVDRMKAFASRTTDRARPAYGRVVEQRKRRCSLWGTTNDDHYLRSQTGNRRFLVAKVAIVAPIDIDVVVRDRDQLWGEAAAAEAAGESITLDEKLWSAAAEEQERRRTVDPWEETLAYIPTEVQVGDPAGPKQIVHRDPLRERVASADLLTHVLGLPVAQQAEGHFRRLATVMKRLGWQRPPGKRIRVGPRVVNGYWRPLEGTLPIPPDDDE